MGTHQPTGRQLERSETPRLPQMRRGKIGARLCRFEPMEPRQLLAADLHLGAALPHEHPIHEHPAAGYHDSDANTVGSSPRFNDRIGQIPRDSDRYESGDRFGDTVPATISGYVFQDGASLALDGNENPNLPAVRDGVRSSDDAPLPGVVLELRHGISGEPIYVSALLGGSLLADKRVSTVTDAQGYYQFSGLPAGIYAVYQRDDPSGLMDGLNTPGTAGGIAIGAWQAAAGSVIDGLRYLPASGDAILQIVVAAGETSSNNNFSEVATHKALILYTNPPTDLPPALPASTFQAFAAASQTFVQRISQQDVPRYLYGGSSMSYSWHLSVIDAGHPRGEQTIVAPIQQTSVGERLPPFANHAPENARWVLALRDAAGQLTERHERRYGPTGGIPITGDFDGDGITDLAIFADGQWHLDSDGDGREDTTGLWARLGSRFDRPVTGDWNGDGKADIGIYGPSWPHDLHAIRHEPGIADAENLRRNQPKNLPPQAEHAAQGTCRLHAMGTRSREDLIDHVFRYGTAGDIPIAGDWNGDGLDTIGIFRNGIWHRDTDGDGRTTPQDRSARFGRAGDLPVVGDWNGDGISDLGVYRDGTWYLDTNGNDQLDAEDEVVHLGTANDHPITGDFDGDGKDEIGIVVGGRVEWSAGPHHPFRSGKL